MDDSCVRCGDKKGPFIVFAFMWKTLALCSPCFKWEQEHYSGRI